MKNLFPMNEKVRIALSLTLLCGMLVPEVEAKTRDGHTGQAKKGTSYHKTEHKIDPKTERKSEQKVVKQTPAEAQPSANAPPLVKDPCPACGRG